jgi:hypothetical protein
MDSGTNRMQAPRSKMNAALLVFQTISISIRPMLALEKRQDMELSINNSSITKMKDAFKQQWRNWMSCNFLRERFDAPNQKKFISNIKIVKE